MKKSVLLLSGILITQIAFAQTMGQRTILVNPVTLRQLVIEKNTSILTELNQIHVAKDQVNIARGNLLPSLNLSAMVTSTPTFGLSAISFLLPFLSPSNWFNVSVQKASFEVEKDTYWILQLNTYGSALAMYYTMLADQKTKKIYEDEAADLRKIYLTINKQYETLHTVSLEDLNHAKSQYESAASQASAAAELEKQELAAIRYVLAAPLSTSIEFEPSMMPSTPWEEKGIQVAVDYANRIAPEHLQNVNLIKSAQAQRKIAIFGFINSTSLSSQSSGGASATFGNLSAKGTMSLGFANYPTYELSNHNIDAMELREKALTESNTKILEASINSIVEAKKQVDLTTHSEAEMMKVYRSKLKRYSLGLGVSYMTVLLSRTQTVQSSLQKVGAELDLDLQRITLHRALLIGEFASIKGCNAPDGSAPASKGFFRSLFGGKKADRSLDEICHAASDAQSVVPAVAPVEDEEE